MKTQKMNKKLLKRQIMQIQRREEEWLYMANDLIRCLFIIIIKINTELTIIMKQPLISPRGLKSRGYHGITSA
jgi:hypothetical protein